MKKLSKLFVAVLVAIFGITTINAAVEGGSIEINRTETNYETKYNAYRLFDLRYDETNKSYAYTLNEKWAAFFKTNAGKDYVIISDVKDDNGYNYVSLKENADVANLAKKALAYAKANTIVNDGNASIAKGETTATISNLQLGYYLVDSSLGALCHLSSTDLKATVNEKNNEPTIVKTEKNKTTTNAGKSAKIGDIIEYSVVITPAAGYENYVFKDLMDAGLTYKKDATISYEGATPTGAVIDNTATGSYTFKIDFSKVNLDDVTKITVTYTAEVNKNAVIGENNNKAVLDFGDDNETTSTTSSVEVTSAAFAKFSDKGASLKGAQFKLYDAETDGNEIKVVFVETNRDGISVYRVADSTEQESVVEFISAGKVLINGLANISNYFLEETKAPDGFNRLGARVNLAIGVDTPVINTTGTVLPSTGGVGTAMFVMIGSLMIAVIGTTLIAKLRMSKTNA